MLYLVAAVALCVRVGGGGGRELEYCGTVKRIVTLHWNQINNLSEKVSI